MRAATVAEVRAHTKARRELRHALKALLTVPAELTELGFADLSGDVRNLTTGVESAIRVLDTKLQEKLKEAI